ncbi:hypothetical protein DSL72_008335 [Monilinia vaccinii-corymbosi]|uniref:amidase n=1 Tax=Monilinia vaccinii-corymbosi TaxID=61207 RepID=A0A8A3PKD9_9HELO|nr:hypothetical protein DSL72_008335 [Monilinia vaccinii-corymbosi]
MTPPHPTSTWQQIAHRKQQIQQSLIPSAWLLSPPPPPTTLNVLSIPRTSGILTPSELRITETHDATSLAAALRCRALTAEEVSIAFCKRAAIAHQVCNCLTEIFFADAMRRAQWLDAQYARTGTPVGPLHGVPVSLKDTFNVKGYDASIGIASLAEKPARENSLLVDLLLEAGAVLYCKTNVPQTLMALDSANHVFGRVLNPRDRRMTAGGSSGGEAALIAMRGSVLGVGTDVGGSIRIPAMCNGLYGVKPSVQRIPYIGQESGQQAGASSIGLPASAGPIATSVRDCELFLQTISDSKPWGRDPNVAYGMWHEQGTVQEKGQGTLLFGVIRTDGVTRPLPPICKILDETVEKVQRAGHEVVEIDTRAFSKCQSLANSFFGIDGGNYMFDLLDKTSEPLIPWLSTRLKRKPPMDLPTLVDIHARKLELERDMLKVWKDQTGRSVDAIICPVAPHPCPPIDRWNGVGYTSGFVLLDYPCATLPVRSLEEPDLEGDVGGAVLGSWDRVNRGLWDEKSIDRTLYLNTTLCIQVVAPKLQERRLLMAMGILDRILQDGRAKAML